MKSIVSTGLLMALLSIGTPALANPMTAVAGAEAVAGALSTSDADANAKGVGVGGGGTGTGTGGSVENKSGKTIAAALGQAPTALSVEGVCGKGTKVGFGALEWSDYSSKCFNYQLAIIAAQQGEWSLTNEWVKRADGM